MGIFPRPNVSPPHPMAHILIIDDDEGFRSLLEQMLAAGGHTVTTAEDGQKGAMAFRAQPTDLVITDLVMPRGGLLAIRVLREQFPDVKMIAMSGSSSHRLDYARALGAYRTLAKPFTPEQMYTAIAETLASGSAPPSAT
jgi:CheY-like chemotaxis protein